MNPVTMPTTIPEARRLRRWAELALFFMIAPGLVSLGPRWWIPLAILIGGGVCLAVLLMDASFPRQRLLDAAAARRGLPRLLLRTAVVWTGILLFALFTRGPQGMFLLPRSRPAVWLAVLIVYPVYSVYLQEVMYRTFFFHRYADLFRSPRLAIIANALLFGWAHVVAHNFLAVLLTALGGLLLASSYQRTRSTLLVAVEHALYGDFLFTVGMPGMFINAVRMLSKVI
jgi:CAAX protease family protein